jgi:N-ethylmaleimide reductase
MPSLFDPIVLGDIAVANRIIMAPLTRSRAGASRIPNDLMAEYYAQRASAGLIISEATAISPQGYGWSGAPAMYNDEQQEGWKKITRAVHERGGKIVLQLWHMGRVSHPDFQEGQLPVAPSAIAATGSANTPEGKKPYVTPRALETAELPGIVQDYVRAAQRAIAAGFDGVEIHAANGYLLDQFIRSHSNQRNDQYGGSIENRLRLVIEVVEAVGNAIGFGRTGIRLSPNISYNGMGDADPVATYTALMQALNAYDLAYVHVRETLPNKTEKPEIWVGTAMRDAYQGNFIVNGGYDGASAQDALNQDKADAVAFGMLFIANPDLVDRIRKNVDMNKTKANGLYAGGVEGYTDYPLLRQD